MSTTVKITVLSIVVSLVGIGLAVVERVHHGWWPF